MQRLIISTSVGAVLGFALLATPFTASASCSDRKVTGTVIGGVGGALVGNSISHGGGGAILGGLGGAVLGHHIGSNGCGDNGHRRYSRHYRARHDRQNNAPQQDNRDRNPERDQYGNPR